MDTEESATHNDTQTIERQTIKRRASEAGVDVPESSDADAIVEQLKSDMERLAKQNHEAVVILAKQSHATIAATLGAIFVYGARRKLCTPRESGSKDRRRHQGT